MCIPKTPCCIMPIYKSSVLGLTPMIDFITISENIEIELSLPSDRADPFKKDMDEWCCTITVLPEPGVYSSYSGAITYNFLKELPSAEEVTTVHSLQLMPLKLFASALRNTHTSTSPFSDLFGHNLEYKYKAVKRDKLLLFAKGTELALEIIDAPKRKDKHNAFNIEWIDFLPQQDFNLSINCTSDIDYIFSDIASGSATSQDVHKAMISAEDLLTERNSELWSLNCVPSSTILDDNRSLDHILDLKFPWSLMPVKRVQTQLREDQVSLQRIILSNLSLRPANPRHPSTTSHAAEDLKLFEKMPFLERAIMKKRHVTPRASLTQFVRLASAPAMRQEKPVTRAKVLNKLQRHSEDLSSTKLANKPSQPTGTAALVRDAQNAVYDSAAQLPAPVPVRDEATYAPEKDAVPFLTREYTQIQDLTLVVPVVHAPAHADVQAPTTVQNSAGLVQDATALGSALVPVPAANPPVAQPASVSELVPEQSSLAFQQWSAASLKKDNLLEQYLFLQRRQTPPSAAVTHVTPLRSNATGGCAKSSNMTPQRAEASVGAVQVSPIRKDEENSRVEELVSHCYNTFTGAELQLQILISEQLLHDYPCMVAELNSTFGTRAVDCALESPVSAILDFSTAVCIISSASVAHQRTLKSFVRQLTAITFKFSVIHIIITIDASDNCSNSSSVEHNTSMLMLSQAVAKFPSRVSIREVEGTDTLLSRAIAHLCGQSVRDLSLAHANPAIKLTHSPFIDSARNGDAKFLAHCEFLQFFPSVNYFLAAALLHYFPLRQIVQIGYHSLCEKLRSNHYLPEESEVCLKQLLELCDVHAGMKAAV